MQLKVVVVEYEQEPLLVFVASKTIEIGDELLFDYNDGSSKMAFLSRNFCPVCKPDKQNLDTEATTSRVKKRRGDATSTSVAKR